MVGNWPRVLRMAFTVRVSPLSPPVKLSRSSWEKFAVARPSAMRTESSLVPDGRGLSGRASQGSQRVLRRGGRGQGGGGERSPEAAPAGG